MLSISKPQTNLIYLSILVGRLDLTRFSIKTSIGSGILLTEICLLNPQRGTGVINLNLLFTIRLAFAQLIYVIGVVNLFIVYFASLYSVFHKPHT